MKLAVMFVIVLAISVTLFTFADIGGNIALSIAKNHLSKNYGISLTADNISGNPIRGYTIRNLGLTDEITSTDIFTAGFLSVNVNLSALLVGNLRLSEISLGGISMDVDSFADSLMKFDVQPSAKPAEISSSFIASPAYADDGLPNIPLDRFRIVDSIFTSRRGVLEVREILADIARLNINVDGKINGLPLRGKIDMEGLTAINRSEIYLGNGKIIATGELFSGGKIDIHMFAEDFDMREITALFPALRAEDFHGKVDFTADISGNADSPILRGSFDYLGAKIFGWPVERASANIIYASHRIAVSNIQASTLNIPVQGEIAAAFRPGKPVSLMMKLDGSESDFSDMDKILGIPELKALGGKVSLFSVNISGTTESLNGLINFTAPRITYDRHTLTDLRAQMKLSGSSTANVEGKFTFEGTPSYLSGKVSSLLTAPNINLTAKIAGLDIKRIESMIPDSPQYKLDGKITASINVNSTASNLNLTGEVNSSEFSGWGYNVANPAINFAYSGNTLTIIKTEGTLNGMPLRISGNISEIPSANPKLDISATIAMTSSDLKKYAPDIDSYDFTGVINAGLKIGGDMDNPTVRLLAHSENLRAMGNFTAKNIEITAAKDTNLTSPDKVSANITADELTAGGITLTEASANISRNGDKIILGGFSAQGITGAILGTGTASLSGKTPLDFSFRFTDFAVGTLAGNGVEGKLSGTLRLAGNNSDPAMTLSANIPALKAPGFTAENITAEISGNIGNLSGAGNLSAGEGTITGLKLLNLLTKSDGLKFSEVNAPVEFETGKLVIKSGTVINAVKGETLYRYAKLSRDGTINFADGKITLDIPAEICINAKLMPSVSGDVTSDDFRVITIRVHGRADSPEIETEVKKGMEDILTK